jgi:hypothetical protein
MISRPSIIAWKVRSAAARSRVSRQPVLTETMSNRSSSQRSAAASNALPWFMIRLPKSNRSS